jgi:2,4-dienoyl-CoA reductase-like NADH-dependent reductase (Old Yellow Enzyme family)
MSPAGAGNRPADMRALCPSEVPVKLGDGWLDKLALDKVLGTPKAMTVEEIDDAVENFVRGAVVARDAGFAGCQLHGAHGFLLSQFLSPHTNRREDDYGGTPEKRMTLLKRLVKEIRVRCPPPYCLSVKLNSGDYMASGGLQQSEALEQVRWLATCGMIDFIEISGGNAEQATSKLHGSFGKKTIDTAPKMRESTRIREGFFTDFAEQVQALKSPVPIQLSGGFRSRTGMADAVDSGVCDLIGLGRAAVLEPELPRKVLLNPEVGDEAALGMSHVVRGQWFANLIPAKVIGGGLAIQFFYYNMRRLGRGLRSDPYVSIPTIFFSKIWEGVVGGLRNSFQRLAIVKTATGSE